MSKNYRIIQHAIHRTTRYALLSLICALLSACAVVSEVPSDADAAIVATTNSEAGASASTAANPPVPEEIEFGSFTEDQLYQAIISELGAQRGDLADAGKNYFDLAIDTRDLTIIRRAIQFASVNGDNDAQLELGLLWAEISPDDPQPHLMLAFQFLENGGLDQAMLQMARVLDLGGNIDFSTLSARSGRLSDGARAGLIVNLRQLRKEFPETESIRVALIQMLAQNQEFEGALEELHELRRATESNPPMIQLEAQILQSMDRGEEALKTLRNGVKRFEDNKRLRLSYARLLIEHEDFSAARRQFQVMIEQDPQDWETQYSVALLDLEMENWDDAAIIFIRLIGVDQRTDESQYYLGFLYQQQEKLARSVEHFRQVRIGTNNFLAAQQQATRLSIQLGDLDDAHQWLSRLSRGQPQLEILLTTIESNLLIQAEHGDNAKSLLDRALNKYPNETDLLFARVLFYDSVVDRAGSEADLQQIISMKPDDSQALNHLGYMLVDQTTRFDEGLELLERAIAIAPDEPAIIDSLAWAQYKLGRYEEALQNLRRAFAVFPDHEVASHLGEVLWMMGRKEEASAVWQDALQDTPDSDLIREVLERFQAK